MLNNLWSTIKFMGYATTQLCDTKLLTQSYCVKNTAKNLPEYF